jgi:hypothetical protein
MNNRDAVVFLACATAVVLAGLAMGLALVQVFG